MSRVNQENFSIISAVLNLKEKLVSSIMTPMSKIITTVAVRQPAAKACLLVSLYVFRFVIVLLIFGGKTTIGCENQLYCLQIDIANVL
jgi:CBS domain containing-hemolysin-like protein